MTPSTHEALVRAREALEIIAGKRQCRDNLMGNADVANAVLPILDAALLPDPKASAPQIELSPALPKVGETLTVHANGEMFEAKVIFSRAEPSYFEPTPDWFCTSAGHGTEAHFVPDPKAGEALARLEARASESAEEWADRLAPDLVASATAEDHAPDPKAVVYCLLCIDTDDSGHETTHIFTTAERRQQWADTDERTHIFYTYTLDAPERHEEPIRDQ